MASLRAAGSWKWGRETPVSLTLQMVKIVYQVSIGVNTLEDYVYFADGQYSGAFGGGCGRAPNDYNNSSVVTQDPRV